MPAGHVAGLGGKGLNYNQHRKNLRKEEVLLENSHSSNAQIPKYNEKIIFIIFS